MSGTAFEFAPGSPVLANAKTNVTLAYTNGITDTYGGDYSAGYQDPKSPASTVTFAPRGRVERVRPIYDSNGQLARVREIVLGTCSLSGNQVQIQARVLDHRMPGTVTPGTIAPLTSQVSGQIQVRADFFHNGQKLDLTSANQAPTPNPDTSSGVVQQTVTLTPLSGSLPTHGVVRVTAWINDPADFFSAPADLNEDADAWASLNLNRGTVVTLDALPDVGDDKNTGAIAKRAKFVLKRTGSTDSALPVKVRLRNHKLDGGANDPRLIKPGTSTSIIAAYGNTQDYHLIPSPWPTSSQTLPYETTVSISSSQSEVVFTVVPKVDNLTENNVIVLQALPDATYSVGLQDRAEVLLYDGPEYTLYELTQYGTSPNAAAVAVNAGVITGGDWSVPPQAVGSALSMEDPIWRGALWTSASAYPINAFGTTFLPYGISFRASPAAGDRPWVVGANGTMAWRVLDNNTGGVQLPHFSSSSGPSLAWGISPDGNRSVGYSTASGVLPGVHKPAVWLNTASPLNLSKDLTIFAEGEARAVNDAGVIVGFCTGFGDWISRPFRSDGSYLDDQDDLPVPTNSSGNPLGNGEGRANAIATLGTNHYAVGSYKDLNSKKNGAYWIGAPLPASVVDLKRLIRNGTFDAEAEALGINSSRKIVGWSGPSEVHANRHAVFSVNGSAWMDLNDKHFTHGLTDWVLQQANAISDTGVIIGVGTKSGATRGFMLVPRIPGN